MTPEVNQSSLGAINNLHWTSPYQDARFIEAADNAGLHTNIIETERDVLYFVGQSNDALTAWEVSRSIEVPQNLPDHLTVYQQSLEPSYADDTYSTIALLASNNRFNPRFMRSVQRAEQKITPEQFREIIELNEIPYLFSAFKTAEHRGTLDLSTFQRLVVSLAEVGIARCFVIDHPYEERPIGASVVLDNGVQSNLRYYTASREIANTGHLLQFRVINHLFDDGRSIVDQSGYTTATNDPKMLGINAFKDQIGGTVYHFNKQR